MIRLIIVFTCLIVVPAAAQTPDADTNRRTCAIALNKAEADLAAVVRATHQVQGLMEITIEDLKTENAKLKKELEEAKSAK